MDVKVILGKSIKKTCEKFNCDCVKFALRSKYYLCFLLYFFQEVPAGV